MREAKRMGYPRGLRSAVSLVGATALVGVTVLIGDTQGGMAAESGSPLAGGSLLSSPTAAPAAPGAATPAAAAEKGTPLGGGSLLPAGGAPAASTSSAGKGSLLGGGSLLPAGGAPAASTSSAGKGSLLGGGSLLPAGGASGPPAAAAPSGSLFFTPGAPPPPANTASSEPAGAPADQSHYRDLADQLYKATSSDAAAFEQALTDPALRHRLEQALKTSLTDDKLRALAAHAHAEADYWDRYRHGLAQAAAPGKEGEGEKEMMAAKSLPPWAIGRAPPAPPLPPPPAGGPYLFPLGQVTALPGVRATPLPLLGTGQLPERPAPLLEIGNGFLNTGPLSQGFELPGGAVWQPRLWVFGSYRTALQSFDPGTKPRVSEWANRLDLFANLQLTGTERMLVGLRPLDRDMSGQFTGWQFEPSNGRGGKHYWNANISTLFFEGDLGSTLPNLDRKGVLPIDFGYTIGRQSLSFQNGMLINDTIDAVGITRNSIHLPFTSNVLVSGFYADSHIRRPNRPFGGGGSQPKLWGIITSSDVLESTYDVDLIRVNDNSMYGDAWYGGAAVIQRFGLVNTAFRVNGSLPDGPQNAVSTKGLLVSLETSFTPFRSDDLVYMNPYVAIGNFTQASKDPIVPAPLGPLGITYSAFGIGTSISPLSSTAQDVAGFATGYEAFWDNHRRSLTLELGVREQTRNHTFNAQALAARFQQAIGQRVVLEVDTFVSRQENHDTGYGARMEFSYQF